MLCGVGRTGMFYYRRRVSLDATEEGEDEAADATDCDEKVPIGCLH